MCVLENVVDRLDNIITSYIIYKEFHIIRQYVGCQDAFFEVWQNVSIMYKKYVTIIDF